MQPFGGIPLSFQSMRGLWTLGCLLASSLVHADGVITGFTSISFGHWPASGRTPMVMTLNPGWCHSIPRFTYSVHGGFLWSQTVMQAEQPSAYEARSVQPVSLLGSGFLSAPINDKVVVGLGLYSPVIMTGKWPEQWIGKFIVKRFHFQSWCAQPVFSYKLSEHTSVGLSPIFHFGILSFSKDVDFQSQAGTSGSMELSGVGFGLGGKAGLFTAVGPIGVGLSAFIPVAMGVNGDARFAVPTSLSDSFPATDYYLPLDLSSGIGIQFTYDLDGLGLVSAGCDYSFRSTGDSALVDFSLNTSLLRDDYIHLSRSGELRVWAGLCDIEIRKAYDLSFGATYSTGGAREGLLTPLAPDAGNAGLHLCVSTPVSEQMQLEVGLSYMETARITGSLKSEAFMATYKSRTWGIQVGLAMR
jgi:long-chain fatty acid transport protein